MPVSAPITPRLVVGLGNPDPEHEATRHNCGFWWIERLARDLGVALRREARFHGRVAHERGRDLWLLAPLTYMNRSGTAVAALARFYRLAPAQTLVVHDELDLPPGSLRLKFGGGLGGHNGLKDIAAHLGTQDFWRLRIGIGHPGERSEVVSYVLKPPRREELPAIDESIDRALLAWPLIERGDYAGAMQRLHPRPAPPDAAKPRESKP